MSGQLSAECPGEYLDPVQVGMYRISGSGSGWPDIRPFLAIRFRQKYWPSPDIAAG